MPDMEVENLVPSTQVLGEFYVTVTRKLSNPVGPDTARKAADDPCAFRIRPLQAELVRAAASRSGASKLSYRDALIVETAIDAGAAVLLDLEISVVQIDNILKMTDIRVDTLHDGVHLGERRETGVGRSIRRICGNAGARTTARPGERTAGGEGWPGPGATEAVRRSRSASAAVSCRSSRRWSCRGIRRTRCGPAPPTG